tara:strand:+ start:15 stop:221 length:207 start_codon:yes stop_codon:yes gene_type:complete
LEFTINNISSENAILNPSSSTLFLSKLISKGLDISILSISNALLSTFVVEKKNIIRDRNIKKIYKKTE